MRPDRALETVKQDQKWSVVRTFEMVNVEKIAIRSVEPFNSCFVERLSPEKFSP
jgi:hypothetical protein